LQQNKKILRYTKGLKKNYSIEILQHFKDPAELYKLMVESKDVGEVLLDVHSLECFLCILPGTQTNLGKYEFAETGLGCIVWNYGWRI